MDHLWEKLKIKNKKERKERLKIGVSNILIKKGSPNEVWGKGVYGVLVVGTKNWKKKKVWKRFSGVAIKL